MTEFLLLIIGIIGALLLVLPTEFILAFDGQTGRWLYESWLCEKEHDKITALERARCFYRSLGITALTISALFFIF
jgi:hypothetical protein